MAKEGARSHRNLGPIQGRQATTWDADPPRDARSAGLDGYHNFGDKPAGPEGLDLEVLVALAGLVNNAVAVVDKPPQLNAPDADGKGGVGAGYTYLYQLAAHDLVQTQVTGLADFGLPSTLRNLQRRPLALETLFDTGPLGCPFAYDTAPPAGHAAAYPARLRCGRPRAEKTDPVQIPPMHDLPRVAFDPAGLANQGNPPETVLIADARNDDNLILGQLTALFLRIYNFLVKEIAARENRLREEEMEELARSMLVRLYRRILREDLLARILHPAIHAAYADKAGPPVLDTARANGTPSIEFALAAVRLGHSMVRTGYQLNAAHHVDLHTVLTNSSQHAPKNMPLRANYLVDWRFFFPPVGAPVPQNFNWAIRFGPHAANAMKMALAAETPGPDGKTLVRGTVFRDLAREASGGLQTIKALLDQIMAKPGPVTDALGIYADPAKPDEIVAAGLQMLVLAAPDPKEAQAQDVPIVVAENPPLSLFLQFEAQALGAGGATLGPLGSVLVAEAMWPAFGPERWETGNGRLDTLETDILGVMPSTMPDLLAALKAKSSDVV